MTTDNGQRPSYTLCVIPSETFSAKMPAGEIGANLARRGRRVLISSQLIDCFFFLFRRPTQLMEVQPHCLLKNSMTTPSASIQRSKSMMTSSSSSMGCRSYNSKSQHATRFTSGSSARLQHHAVEIHHPDDGSGGAGPPHSSPAAPATSPSSSSMERHQHQQRDEEANNSLTSSSRQGNEIRPTQKTNV